MIPEYGVVQDMDTLRRTRLSCVMPTLRLADTVTLTDDCNVTSPPV